MRKLFTLFGLVIYSGTQAIAQEDSLWTLERSIRYAIEHNLDVQQGALNERLADLQLQQSILSQIPSISASGNYGRSFGRSIDPTSNQFINSEYDFIGLNGSADVLLFGWFQRRYKITQNNLLHQASQADLDQLKNDISLNVATGFLRILLAREQIAVSENQLKLSVSQKEQITEYVASGRSPEFDLAQIEAQVATDSSNYISTLINYNQSVLDMKALMNFELSYSYYAVVPSIDSFSFTDIALESPQHLYEHAAQHFGAIKSGKLNVEAAKKGLASTKASLYPQLGFGAQWGSNYSTTIMDYTNVMPKGMEPTGNIVEVDGQYYNVMQPTFDFSSRITPLNRQLSNNFRHTYALSINVPIFNGWSTRTSIAQSKVDLQSKELNRQRAELKLKQDVYKAYYEAQAAVQKYYATQKASSAAERASELAQQRHELGLVNTVELLTTQNTALQSKTDALSAKYDLIFKLKVIDYYLGKELKL